MHTLAVGHGRGNPPAEVLARAPGMVEALLAHGADPNAPLSGTIIQRQHTGGDGLLGEGATPLLRAAKSGDFELVRMLAAAGAEPRATMANGTTALMFAAGLGWRNGSPAAPSFDQGTDEGAIQTIDFLLERGVDLNAQKENGDTALHVAVSGRGSEAIVRHLLERGSDPSILNGRDQTPGDIAGSRNSPLAGLFGE
jgi:ankyrin repeat protein